MAGWLSDLLAEQGSPAVVTPAEPGRDVTARRRPIELTDFDMYTSNELVEAGHQRVYVGSASLISVQARLQGTGAGGVGWANRSMIVQRVIGGQHRPFASAKTLTPSAPTCEITAAELGGADTISIAAAAAGTVDAIGLTTRVTVTVQEDVTPVAIETTTLGRGRLTITGSASNTPFGE